MCHWVCRSIYRNHLYSIRVQNNLTTIQEAEYFSLNFGYAVTWKTEHLHRQCHYDKIAAVRGTEKKKSRIKTFTGQNNTLILAVMFSTVELRAQPELCCIVRNLLTVKLTLCDNSTVWGEKVSYYKMLFAARSCPQCSWLSEIQISCEITTCISCIELRALSRLLCNVNTNRPKVKCQLCNLLYHL